jgi:hypothetical protein
VEEGHAIPVDRLHQRHVGDPVVDAPVAVAIKGVAEEGQVAGLGHRWRCAGAVERDGPVRRRRERDGEPCGAVGREHIAGAVEPGPRSQQAPRRDDDPLAERGAVGVLLDGAARRDGLGLRCDGGAHLRRGVLGRGLGGGGGFGGDLLGG